MAGWFAELIAEVRFPFLNATRHTRDRVVHRTLLGIHYHHVAVARWFDVDGGEEDSGANHTRRANNEEDRYDQEDTHVSNKLSFFFSC